METNRPPRARLVEGAVEELRVHGPEGFSTARLCGSLAIPQSSVNYHFGSRLGLIREAAVTAYEEYGAGFALAFRDAGSDPRVHLQRHCDHQLAWTVANRSIMNLITGADQGTFDQSLQARIIATAHRNILLLSTAIVGLLDGAGRSEILTEPEFAARPDVALALAMVSWLSTGRALWQANWTPVRDAASDASRSAELLVSAELPATALAIVEAIRRGDLRLGASAAIPSVGADERFSE